MRNLLARPAVCALLFALVTFGSSVLSFAAVFVSVNIAPPVLPVYAQPLCPGAGYIWTPGYWAWGDDGYYWVPGTWVFAPFIGALWTPGWWGWDGGDDAYIWHAGYWGPHVGFYGGINYGFGYGGEGYEGGHWNRGAFVYNTAVNNVNRTTIRNTYSVPVRSAGATHVSYNGGSGVVAAQPTAQDRLVEHEQHRLATPAQVQHQQAARSNRAQFATVNHGRPAIVATPRPAAKVVASGPASRSAATATAKSAAVPEHGVGGAKAPATNATTATTQTSAHRQHTAEGTRSPAAGTANHAPAVTAATKSSASREHTGVAAKAPATAAVNHAPAVATNTNANAHREHTAAASRAPATATVNRAPTVTATARPQVKEQRIVASPTPARTATPTPARTANVATGTTHSSPNPRLADSHASSVNGNAHPGGGAPQAQNAPHAPAPAGGNRGGGNGAAHPEEEGKSR
ncbi:MAG TPA: YXWGXW repeat-containing protein [Casimicrobiaceae bacterium]|nr:YXWGXW repeat-containing protein [Casimicrobiaceae bacterium]